MRQEQLDLLNETKEAIRRNILFLASDLKKTDESRYNRLEASIDARIDTACEIIDSIRFIIEARR